MSEKSKLELEKVNKEDDKSKRKKPVAKAKSKEKINEGDLTSEGIIIALLSHNIFIINFFVPIF